MLASWMRRERLPKHTSSVLSLLSCSRREVNQLLMSVVHSCRRSLTSSTPCSGALVRLFVITKRWCSILCRLKTSHTSSVFRVPNELQRIQDRALGHTAAHTMGSWTVFVYDKHLGSIFEVGLEPLSVNDGMLTVGATGGDQCSSEISLRRYAPPILTCSLCQIRDWLIRV